MSQNIVVTGAPKVANPPGTAPAAQPRLDIRDFVKNEKYLSLYIQALAAFSAIQQDKDRSHFGVGGIHGLPYRPWSHSGAQPVDPNGWEGYCTHGTVLFPTWHRPYLGAYEQFIQEEALRITSGYNDPAWVTAAQTIRLPYWDWASGAVPPDEVINKAQITIATPSGPKTVPNPLYGYVFHPIDSSFQDTFATWKKTLRRPTNDSPNAQDNVAALKRALSLQAGNITKSTYLLFSIRDWDHFSNHTSSRGSSVSSLESIHDNIHVLVGGSGHMGDPRYAGHDPIFYLHHCNVDRLLALWQAVHYDVPITNGDSGDGTRTIKPGTQIGKDSPLTPFWNSQTSFWNSTATTAGCQDFTNLGYTYPEFKGLDLNNKPATRTAIIRKVEELYGSGVRPGPRLGSAAPGGQATFASGAGEASLNYDHEWSARISCNQFELGGSFFVLVYLGQPPVTEDPFELFESENLLGCQGFFVNSASQQCGNCKTQIENGTVVEAFVHMSNTLLEKEASDTGALEPEKILPYLKKVGVHARVVKSSGEIVDPEKFKSLAVEVVATPLSADKKSPLPQLGEVHKYYSTYTAEDDPNPPPAA